MPRAILFILMLSAGVAGLSGCTAPSPAGPDGGPAPRAWVAGYYAGYQRDAYPPSAIDFTAITHLMIGPVVPRADGTLDTSLYLPPGAGPALLRDLAQRAHAAGRKALAMIGGAGARVHQGWVGASSPEGRAALVAGLVKLRQDAGLDGFDLDWEPVASADQPALRALAQALRAASPGAVLTLPVAWVNANHPAVDPFYGEIAPLFDQINVMTYGMAGAWTGWQSWHTSALSGAGPATPSSVESSVAAYLQAGVPASRLGLGIGLYGQCWTGGVSAPRQPLPSGTRVISDDTATSLRAIAAGYDDPAARRWDDAAQAPYLGFPAPRGALGCTLISYEDERSVAAKGAFARAHGLGGAIIWTLNEGHLASGDDPVLAAVRQAFLE